MLHRKKPPNYLGSVSPPFDDGNQTEKSKVSVPQEDNAATVSKTTSRKVSPLSVTPEFPHGQKDDLERQAEFLRSKYPRAEIITEIGSGLNFKRKRFLSILERIHQRNVALLAVAYPDRLARFGFPLIEWLCEQCEGQLVVLNESKLSPHEELVQDILSILHCFSARLYGLRKYQKQAEKVLQEEPTQPLREEEAQQCLKNQGLSLQGVAPGLETMVSGLSLDI